MDGVLVNNSNMGTYRKVNVVSSRETHRYSLCCLLVTQSYLNSTVGVRRSPRILIKLAYLDSRGDLQGLNAAAWAVYPVGSEESHPDSTPRQSNNSKTHHQGPEVGEAHRCAGNDMTRATAPTSDSCQSEAARAHRCTQSLLSPKFPLGFVRRNLRSEGTLRRSEG